MDIETFIKKVEKLGIEVAQTLTTVIVPCGFAEHSDIPKGKTANMMIGKRTRIGKGIMCSHEGNLEEIFGALQKMASEHTKEPASDEIPQPRIMKVDSIENEITFLEWRETIKDNFPDLAFAAEVGLAIIAQILITDITNPFALVLVDVPSSGKTITINFFQDIEGLTYASDKFTPASFVSNATNVKKKDLPKIDLLPRIRYKMLLLRDFATLLSKREDDLNELMGLLTRVLDGEGLNTDSGIHGQRQYNGEYLFMVFAASTPIQPRVWNLMANLGSRLFFLNMGAKEKTEAELVEQLRSGAYKGKEKACRRATKNFVLSLWKRNQGGVVWDAAADKQEYMLVISRCSKLLAKLRGSIKLWEKGSLPSLDGENYEYSPTVVEMPDRINQLFYNLCRGHALVCGRTHLEEEDIRLAAELAIDSVQPVRAKLFRALVDHNGQMTTAEVMEKIRCSRPKALKEMEALVLLGVCSYAPNEVGDVGGQEKIIRLIDDFLWFLGDECKRIRGISTTTKGRTTSDLL